MKLALLLNKTNWATEAVKIKAVTDFFASVDNLQITVFHTNFSNFQWSTVDTIGGITNTIGAKETLTLQWLETNIKKAGFDTCALYLDAPNCVGHNYPTAIDYEVNPGMIVLYGAAGLSETDTASVNNIQLGNSFVLFLEHELCHQYYHNLGRTDNTHQFFYTGNPTGVLAELKPMELYKQFTQYPKIYAWAKAIAPQEGARPNLCNPGNLKVTNLTKSWGATNGFQATDGGWIAKFKDIKTGFQAQVNLLTMISENIILGYHLDRTFEGVTKVYAGNPLQSYIDGVAKAIPCKLSTDVGTFLT